MRSLENRVKKLEESVGGSEPLSVFLTHFGGEWAPGEIYVGGTLVPRNPQESMEDYRERAASLAPVQQGGIRILCQQHSKDE